MDRGRLKPWEKICSSCEVVFVTREAARTITSQWRYSLLTGGSFDPELSELDIDPRNFYRSVRKYCYECSPSRVRSDKRKAKAPKPRPRVVRKIPSTYTERDKLQEGTDQWLYRMFNKEGDLLYVGISNNPFARLRAHSREKPWIEEVSRWEREYFVGRKAVREAELEAIRLEKPKYNIAYNVAERNM